MSACNKDVFTDKDFVRQNPMLFIDMDKPEFLKEEGENGTMSLYSVGVLLVHGIQGSPEQFRFLTDLIPGNTYVNCHMLPGHGAGVRDFRRSEKEEWSSAVFEAAEEMRAQCDKVVFVGHSMGCLLGILSENIEPGLFDGMLLLCCPFSVRPTFRYLINNIRSVQKAPKNPYVRAVKEANSVSTACPLAYLTCIHPYAELLRLIRKVKNIDLSAVPTHFIFSDRDEIVSPRSAAIARSNHAYSIRTMSDCGHQYFPQTAKDEIVRIFFDILNAVKNE